MALATFAITVLLYVTIPKGLFPTQDTGQLQARVQAAQDVSYDRMAELQAQAARAILADPAVLNLSSIVGVDAANNTMLQTGSMLINLEAVARRPAGRHEPFARPGAHGARRDAVPAADAGPDDRRRDGPDGIPRIARRRRQRADHEVDGRADRAACRTRRRCATSAATPARRASTSNIDVDRDTASRLGITASAVDDALYSAFGQRIVSTIFTDTNQYRVILEAQPGLATSAEGVGKLNLISSSGRPTPLSAFARITEQLAPLQITHVGQYPASTLNFDTAPGVSLGQAVDAIRKAARDIALPSTITLSFLGASGAYERSLANELWLILAAVVCVYIVLGVLYESYVHPLTILSTLPSAGVGALLALIITGNDLGVISIIGIILLIGIVKKNAIMMIDFAIDAEREQGMSARDAIHQAALLRLRPILMTTFAALFAAVPLMLSWGVGAELRRPLGLAIFGGLIVSQMLTLFTTPVIYLAFDRLGGGRTRRIARRHRRASTRRAEVGSEPVAPVRAAADRHGAADGGRRARGHRRFLRAAGGVAAADRPSGDFGQREHSRRESGNDGEQRCDAARAPPRHDPERQRDHVDELGRCDARDAAVRSRAATSTAPRATCRRPSTRRASTCPRRCAQTRRIAR